ncbi:MAG: ribbon-helix-helix protein, CopG family [Alphaproteobacteria bacterium]|nr:ribbon-helix-helix protein, CopG family [Alphaproteobacteria bacterium]
MAEIERMTIALTAEMAKLVRAAVEAGEYASSSEIIREALRDWSDKRFLRRRDLEELRVSIRQGIKDIKDGKGIPVEEAFSILRARRGRARRRA